MATRRCLRASLVPASNRYLTQWPSCQTNSAEEQKCGCCPAVSARSSSFQRRTVAAPGHEELIPTWHERNRVAVERRKLEVLSRRHQEKRGLIIFEVAAVIESRGPRIRLEIGRRSFRTESRQRMSHGLIKRELRLIQIGPRHQRHAVLAIANNAGHQLTAKWSPGRIIVVALRSALDPGLNQRMAEQNPWSDTRHELGGEVRGIDHGPRLAQRAHKSAQLLGTRLRGPLAPPAKTVVEKDRAVVGPLRIAEDKGTGLMIITCRLATLPVALLDEGENKLFVGFGRLRSKQRHEATEHPRAPEMAGVQKKKSEGQHIN